MAYCNYYLYKWPKNTIQDAVLPELKLNNKQAKTQFIVPAII